VLAAGAAACGVALLERLALAAPLDDALGRIAAARAPLKTLLAAFKQVRTIGLLATEVESRGELTIVRPDRLRWELRPPDAVTYWVGPEGFAMATADGVVKVGKAAAGRFGAVLEDLLVLLGGDLRQLKERYELEASPVGAGLALSAKPRADRNPEVAKHVSVLRMQLGAELWQVERLSIEERSGDRSVVAFEPNRRDVPVAPETMRPPPKR
jgi:outer membrane lipoprotein-sorting protein